MPTFDEPVTVNWEISIANRGEGAVLLNLAIERSWRLRQRGTGNILNLSLPA